MEDYMSQIVINIKDVEKGKTKNWLKFRASIGYYDSNKEYTINFCGTEVEIYPEISLEEKEIKTFKKMLDNDFGYPPYDEKIAKKIIETGKEYIIKRIIRRS